MKSARQFLPENDEIPSIFPVKQGNSLAQCGHGAPNGHKPREQRVAWTAHCAIKLKDFAILRLRTSRCRKRQSEVHCADALGIAALWRRRLELAHDFLESSGRHDFDDLLPADTTFNLLRMVFVAGARLRFSRDTIRIRPADL